MPPFTTAGWALLSMVEVPVLLVAITLLPAHVRDEPGKTSAVSEHAHTTIRRLCSVLLAIGAVLWLTLYRGPLT